MNPHDLINKLNQEHNLTKEEWIFLIKNKDLVDREALYQLAREIREKHYGKEVYIRGLIEFSNHCKNDCLYCGIRRSNINVERYRLSDQEILECCNTGYRLGFRTFVLQSGEDPYYTPEHIAELVRTIKNQYPDCAITLSLGEHSTEDYKLWKEAGADRYLLRHETADPVHYSKLHPEEMALSTRLEALQDLRDLGYQVGAGFMVGSPYQTPETLAEDMIFLQEFRPHMVGIGPFIPHKDTPFHRQEQGTLEDTLFFLSLIRLTLPEVLLPATTALGTIHPVGRELGIRAGANVVMPNLSPTEVRDLYTLYDNKICTGDEAAECINCLSGRVLRSGYEIVQSRGDSQIR